MRLQVAALVVPKMYRFHIIFIEWVTFRSAKNCMLLLRQSFGEIPDSVTHWVYFSTRTIVLTLSPESALHDQNNALLCGI